MQGRETPADLEFESWQQEHSFQIFVLRARHNGSPGSCKEMCQGCSTKPFSHLHRTFVKTLSHRIAFALFFCIRIALFTFFSHFFAIFYRFGRCFTVTASKYCEKCEKYGEKMRKSMKVEKVQNAMRCKKWIKNCITSHDCVKFFFHIFALFCIAFASQYHPWNVQSLLWSAKLEAFTVWYGTRKCISYACGEKLLSSWASILVQLDIDCFKKTPIVTPKKKNRPVLPDMHSRILRSICMVWDFSILRVAVGLRIFTYSWNT